MCERRAYAELAGLGDPALGEWQDWTGTYHLRRRLTAAEAASVGPVLDVRGTPEAAARVTALGPKLLRLIPADVLAAEMGEQ